MTIRRVANCHTDHAHKIKGIVQVISPVRPFCHIGGEQQAQSRDVLGILLFAKNHIRTLPIA